MVLVANRAFYTEPGYTATDNYWGNITGDVRVHGAVNVQKIGRYVLNYSVSDLSGNRAVATRTVFVADKTPPLLQLKGKQNVVLNFGNGDWRDPGVTAIDDVDGDLTPYVLSVSNVNAFLDGTYQISYSVYDNAGNVAPKLTRVVQVLAPIDCCRASPTNRTGCSKPLVEQCVCDRDHFCCSVVWDTTCAGRAAACTPSQCPDVVPYQPQLTDDCCLPGPNQKSCGNRNTAACVCKVDPWCCIGKWDEVCVQRAATCDANQCPGVVPLNDCCGVYPNQRGCSAQPIAQCVCKFDTYCCKNHWDLSCARWAAACGANCPGVEPMPYNALENDACLVVPGKKGSSDQTIQECVCSQDAKCCNEQWGDMCTQWAVVCGASCPGCTFIYHVRFSAPAVEGVIMSTTETPSDCCALCTTNPLCDSWYWDMSSAVCTLQQFLKKQVTIANTTYLDNTNQQNMPATGVISGFRSLAPIKPIAQQLLVESTTCCVVTPARTGCDDPTVQKCVCALDPFCCTGQWDKTCAQRALTYCSAPCKTLETVPYCDPGGPIAEVDCAAKYGPTAQCVGKNTCMCIGNTVMFTKTSPTPKPTPKPRNPVLDLPPAPTPPPTSPVTTFFSATTSPPTISSPLLPSAPETVCVTKSACTMMCVCQLDSWCCDVLPVNWDDQCKQYYKDYCQYVCQTDKDPMWGGAVVENPYIKTPVEGRKEGR